jgi:hypothetical protein
MTKAINFQIPFAAPRHSDQLPARWRTALAGCLLACASGWVLAQATVTPQQGQTDLPGRIASIDALQGSAHFQSRYDAAPRAADASWPLTTGDQVWTDRASRLELNTGGASLRLDASTMVDLTQLDDSTAQIKLTRGTISVSVRDVAEGERYEIDTPNLALVLTEPGEWRIDVDQAQGITRVGARRGRGTLYGESAEALAITAPDRHDYVGRNLAQAQGLRTLANDDFERWTLARENALNQSVSARYVSSDMPGIQQLDSYGSWQQDGSLGAVWFPTVTQTDWAPYRYGRWDWVQPWGWTWVDDAPWGFAPSHYGRWTQINTRWAWVPGRVPHRRPTYAPALVAFVGNPGGSGSITLAGGSPGVAWFPLAPGEAWRPPYYASTAYVARLNRGRDSTDYRFHSHPSAVTAWRSDDFGQRHSHRPAYQMVGAAALANARPIGVPYVAPQWARGSGFERTAWRGPQSQPDASLSDRVRQAEAARNQQALEARQQDAIRRQQGLLAAQQQFQPDYGTAPEQFARDNWRQRNGYDNNESDRFRGADSSNQGDRRWNGGRRDGNQRYDNGQQNSNRQADEQRRRVEEEQRRMQEQQRQIRDQQRQSADQQRQNAGRQRDRNQELRNEEEVQRRQQELQRRQIEAGRAPTQQQQNQQNLRIQQNQNLQQLERNRRTGSDVFVPPAFNQNDRP